MAHEGITPRPLTKIIGRKHDLSSLAGMLTNPDIHLVTICGTGGIGKTRLALEAIELVRDDFDDGVILLDLAPITSPDLIPELILISLDVPLPESDSIEEAAIQHLENQHLLLVLDNMEHLLAAAEYLTTLLERCHDVAVLLTSRERIGISFEHILEIAPLPVPDQHSPQTLDAVAGSEAVQLFLERAKAADRMYELTPENAGDVAAICRRLDGLPLAIELAAARVADIPPRLILRNFARILPFLERSHDDPDGRHRTMLNAISWSYGLLPDREKELFRKISIFQSGFTLEEAVDVAGEAEQENESDVALLGALASLVSKHLLLRREWQSDEPRYEMLQTMREYGQDQLRNSGEEATTRDAHATSVNLLADRLRIELRGQHPGPALERYAAGHDEFRAAITWLIGSRPAGDTAAITLCNNLANFWLWRGHAREGKRWYLAALAQAGELESIERATAYLQLGHFTYDDLPAAYNYYEKSLHLYQLFGHKPGTAGLMSSLGLAAKHLGRYDDAERYLNDGLQLFEELENDSGIAHASYHLATIMETRGDYTSATRYLDRARGHWDRAGDSANAVNAVFEMGRVHRRMGQLDKAEHLLRWSLARHEEVGIELETHLFNVELGLLALARNDTTEAYGSFCKAIKLTQRTGVTERFAEAIAGIADLANRNGQSEAAAELMAAIDHWCLKTGYHREPEELEFAERVIRAANTKLGEAAFSMAWNRGALLSPEELSDRATGLRFITDMASESPVKTEITPKIGFALTNQEQVVLCHIARGETNQQIANALFISVRTVAVHVQNILRKLNAENRTHASALAYLAGICSPNPSGRGVEQSA